MKDIVLLNEKFEKSGTFKSNVELSAEEIKVPVVHQVVKAILAGKRQGTAATKIRALVSGGGAKPFKQKGTGRARQGSSRSSLMVGGGTAFGPTPRSYKQKINKKMQLKAIHSVIADKLQAGKLFVVEKLESTGKTKEMFEKLNNKNLLPGLVITEKKDSSAIRATRNIRNATALPVEGFSVYEALKYENLIIEKNALEALLNRLG